MNEMFAFRDNSFPSAIFPIPTCPFCGKYKGEDELFHNGFEDKRIQFICSECVTELSAIIKERRGDKLESTEFSKTTLLSRTKR